MSNSPEHRANKNSARVMLPSESYRALVALTDTIVPSITQEGEMAEFWKLKASDLQTADKIVEVLVFLSDQELADFKSLLLIFSSPWSSLAFTGQFKPFADLPAAKREQWLQKWANSSIHLFRKAISILHKLTTFIFYADTSSQFPNPTWKYLGYAGPMTPPPDIPKPIKPLTPLGDTILECDVVVIGSGAGGGVVAGELATAGKNVIVVEKGGYYNESDFLQLEAQSVASMYEKAGTLASADGSMTIFAGSTLGGGTVINWAGTLRTPDYILNEWAKEHQAPQFETAEYRKSMEAAELAIGKNTTCVHKNNQNINLMTGSLKKGHLVRDIGQNVVNTEDFDQRLHGYSCFGDQFRTKKSTLISYLEPASKHNTRFLTNTEVEKVLIKNGKAIGVKAVYQLNGVRSEITIHASKVVVAAGSVHTPALLKRSGLQHPHIGKHLNLHPVVAITGIYAEKIHPWWGGMMTVTNDQFTQLDGNYGFKLETPPAHTGLIAMSLPWNAGKRHKELMLKAPHLSNIIILTRDRFSGEVKIDKRGKPVIHYQLHPYDLKHLQKGIKESLEIHREAGAKEVMIPHTKLPVLDCSQNWDSNSLIHSLRWKPNDFMLFSAHQMSSCRMGGTKNDHPIAPNGESYEVKNLYVADASAFPSCSGANPMLSIEALAHFIAQGLK